MAKRTSWRQIPVAAMQNNCDALKEAAKQGVRNRMESESGC